jgi:hypothetical protein
MAVNPNEISRTMHIPLRGNNTNTIADLSTDFKKALYNLETTRFHYHDNTLPIIYPPTGSRIHSEHDIFVKRISPPNTAPYVSAYLANPRNAKEIEKIDDLIEWSRNSESYLREYAKIQREMFRQTAIQLKKQTRDLIRVRDQQRQRDVAEIADNQDDVLTETRVLEQVRQLPVELRDIIAAYLPASTIHATLMSYVHYDISVLLNSSSLFRIKRAESYIRNHRSTKFRTMFANARSDSVLLYGMTTRKDHGWESRRHRTKSDFLNDIIGQMRLYDYIHNIFLGQNTPAYCNYASDLRREIRFTIQFIRFVASLPKQKRPRRVREPEIPSPHLSVHPDVNV